MTALLVLCLAFQSPTLTLVEEDDTLTLTLEGAAVLLDAHEVEPRGVVLRFRVPVADFPLAEIRARAAAWFNTVSEGYDSVLLQAPHPLELEVRRVGADLVIVAKRPRDATVVRAEVPDAQRRLDRLRAQILEARKRDLHAQQLLDEVYVREPEDVQSLIDLARQENLLGRWAHAVALYRRALELSPGSNAILQPLGQIALREASRVRVVPGTVDFSGGERQRWVTLDGFVNITDELRFHYDEQVRTVEAPLLRGPDGGLATDFRETATRFRAGLGMPVRALARLRVDLFGADRIGGAVSMTQRVTAREWRLEAAFHEPDWRFAQGFAHEGRRDALRLEMKSRVHEPHLLVSGKAELSRYGLAEEDDVVRGGALALAFRRVFHLAEPHVSIGYNLDAEYLWGRVVNTLPDGIRVPVYDLLQREVHALDLGLAEDLTDYIHLEGNLGYSYDRFGGSGPLAAVAGVYAPIPSLELRLTGVYSATGQQRGGDQRATALDISLLWRF